LYALVGEIKNDIISARYNHEENNGHLNII
jgi:hypothetical protein